MKALFVSDIHITNRHDPRADSFLKFLNQIDPKQVSHLFLVGDIFDLWIADRRYFVEEYAEIIETLKELREKGVSIHYFEGNHDLDLRIFWEKELGVQVHDCAQYFKLGGKVVRVEHGDQMDPEDRGYLFLRWFLRTPLMVWLGRHLPDFVVRWLGWRMSAASRKYTSEVRSVSDEGAVAKVEAHARRVFNEMPFDVFVSGHVHVLMDKVISVGDRSFRYVNLGTWLKKEFVLEL